MNAFAIADEPIDSGTPPHQDSQPQPGNDELQRALHRHLTDAGNEEHEIRRADG